VLAEVAIPIAELDAGKIAQQIRMPRRCHQPRRTRRVDAQENLDHLKALEGVT
jgi:hypothetical protein